MKRVFLAVILLMSVGCKTRSDEEMYQQVLERKKELTSIIGSEIESVDESQHRNTVIFLKNGRTISFKSDRYSHELEIK
jgi:uncharacterized protein YcfL